MLSFYKLYPVFRNHIKTVVIAICTVIIVLPGNGQGYDPANFKQKVNDAYRQAIENLQFGEWEKGKTALQAIVKSNPAYADGWLSLMGAFGERKIYDSAALSFETAWPIDTAYAREYLLSYSINLAGMGKFDKAKEAVSKFLSIPRLNDRSRKAGEYRLGCYQFALDFATSHPNRSSILALENLGEKVNSSSSEYYPSFTIDDSILVFTRRTGGQREDFFQCLQSPNGYTKAEPVKGDLNVPPYKGGIQISADAELLVFAGDFPQSGYGNFDIYACEATPDGWSLPLNLGEKVNSEGWDSGPSLSPDKQALFFSSNRPGGFGGKDLYVCYRGTDGKWGKAMNLGASINTAADELAPYFHVDNRTLYFTSGGHPGYGNTDLYFAQRQPDSSWTKPQNLGFPINTIEDDGSLVIAPNGQTAFFASARAEGFGGLDLYKFQLPEDVRPPKTGWIKGQVFDASTKKGLPSAIQLKDLNSGALLQRIITDETGRYLVTLPEGSRYFFTVDRKGYLYFSKQFNLEKGNEDSTYVLDIPLQSIAKDATLELRNVYFETNAFVLDPLSYPELDKLVQMLVDNPELKVEIGGHTDNTGNSQDNMVLSANRAKAVKDYLVKKGVKEGRLSSKGYGSTKPVQSNDTETGRSANRRTEVKVLDLIN